MKKNMIVFYSILGGITLVGALSLTIWASNGKSNNTEQVTVATKIETTHEARSEYIVGETFDSTGLTIKVDDKTITNEEYTINYDFSSAGRKVVTLSYQKGVTTYEAYYPVQVFAVRHIDIHDKTIYRNDDGTWDLSDFVVWVELSAPSIEFPKPAEYPNPGDTVAILNEKQYSFEIKETQFDGFYDVTVGAGNITSRFAHYEGSSGVPKVDSLDRILQLTNASSTQDKLTLYCQTSTNNFAPWGGNGTLIVTGTYVLENAIGEKTNYSFSYRIDGWTSSFLSSSVTGGELVDQQGYNGDNDAYQVQVKGLTFYASAQAWHKAVLNM